MFKFLTLAAVTLFSVNEAQAFMLVSNSGATSLENPVMICDTHQLPSIFHYVTHVGAKVFRGTISIDRFEQYDCHHSVEGDVKVTAMFYDRATDDSEACYGEFTDVTFGGGAHDTTWKVLGSHSGLPCTTVGQVFNFRMH